MIDPRELRLGNFVKTIVQAYPRFSDKVESIVSIELISKDYCICKDTLEINGVVVSNDYHQKNLSELKPIPLTEDILLKCGFMKGHSQDLLCDDCFTTSLSELIIDIYKNKDQGGWILHIEDESYCWVGYAMNLKYLHELQNLFYDLMKTELNVQL